MIAYYASLTEHSQKVMLSSTAWSLKPADTSQVPSPGGWKYIMYLLVTEACMQEFQEMFTVIAKNWAYWLSLYL